MSQGSKTYCVVGVMSGTSLDGIDIVCCNFHENKGLWSFEVLASEEIPYNNEWKTNLSEAFYKTNSEIQELDKVYGRFLGEKIKAFIKNNHLKPELIASHGHTIFHFPEKGYTLQIGDGAAIAVATETLTINNFRAEDVRKGGQGAPLVPVGDKLLFGKYDICLNIGGIANISYDFEGARIAYDVCPANQPLNFLAEKKGLSFDADGNNARSGKLNPELLDQLNQLGYYSQTFPKSLGREWVESEFMPFISTSDLDYDSLLRTVTEHIAVQIANATNQVHHANILTTGGGTKNKFLIERIAQLCKHDIILPSPKIIDFKEAIVFAFLGVLKFRGETNCYASVTGASEDSSSGDLYLPDRKNGL